MSSAQETKDKRREEEGGIGGAVAGAGAAYESHEAKKNPEDAHKHKEEEGVLGGGAVAGEGGALYEHHEKKKLEKEGEAL